MHRDHILPDLRAGLITGRVHDESAFSAGPHMRLIGVDKPNLLACQGKESADHGTGCAGIDNHIFHTSLTPKATSAPIARPLS